MKLTRLLTCLFLCLMGMSCIQTEAPNAEADIVTCTVPAEILRRDPIIQNTSIVLMVKEDADITQLAPQFELTPGATIEPASGTVRDFTTPQSYVVTSEDRNWKKTYMVRCTSDGITTKFDFEHSELVDNKYYRFYEVLSSEEKQYMWDSGNSGYAIVGGKKGPEEYPTTPYDFGKSGKCLKLETRSTGDLGAMVSMRIAAGNMFIGEFYPLEAMQNALKATHFGLPFDFVPVSLTGYYKYKRGEVFTEKDGSVNPDMKDNFDIYSILYETDDEVSYLDGTNFLTSPNLIAIARISNEEKKETDEWTYFNLPFVYQPGKTIDEAKLANGKYNIAIVFSSSIEGDLFRGAVGSRLLIDEVELVHN